MRIVFIPGILVSDEKLMMCRNLEAAFRGQFEVSKFYAEREYFQAWHFATMKEFGRRIQYMHDTGEDVLLVGHSMGGVIANYIVPMFWQSKVVGVVTINSPHCFLLRVFPRFLGCSRHLAPVVSFAAKRDWMVPWGAKHPRAVSHTVLDADHERDLMKNKNNLAGTIAKISADAINKARRE